MLAPPGAGKGTQAERLAVRYGVEHLASGELLRAEVTAGTEIGRRAEAAIDAGDLVPDEVILEMIGKRLITAAEKGGYVLDGFPRNLGQAKRAYEMARQADGVELQAVVHLTVRREELRRRMLERAEAEGRADDTRGVIEHRLAVYDSQTAPLRGYYGDRGLVHDVDGEGDVDEVTAKIEDALADLSP